MHTNAGTNARVDSTAPPFSFFLQCRSPVLGFFFRGVIFGRFSNPGPGCFFSWGQHEDKGKLQKRRALPEGRAKFCTLTRRREVQNGKAQYRNRVPQLSHPAGEHTPHYQKVVTLVYWVFCEAKCGEVSIDALLQKRGACWAVNHGAR